MVLRSTGRSRERILVYGTEGVGKSLAALDIASRIAPDNTLYVIDNDNAWDRMLEGQTVAGEKVEVREEYRWDPDIRAKDAKGNWQLGGWEADDRWCVEGGNVIVYHAEGWLANTSAIAEVVAVAEPDDWCCVDSGSALWDDLQAWYTESVFDASMADYFLQIRMQKAKSEGEDKALGALDGWVDWPVINAQYKNRVMKFLVTPPCHLIITAEQADVASGNVRGKDIEDKETRALYGGQQVKPRAQKRIGHNMQTVLRFMRKAGDKYEVTTVKDRGGREKLEMQDVTDEGFASWYLEGVAGWTETGSTTTTPTPPVAKTKPVAKS